MRRLRSRWTVVALVPAAFLAGFGIVSALAGGSDDAAPAAGTAAVESGAAGPAIVTTTSETSSEAAPASTEPEATAAGGTTNGANGGQGGGGGAGDGGGDGAPPSPPAGEIAVDYGRWDGVFSLENLELRGSGGETAVAGELHYLGGLECPVGLVRVQAWVYAGGAVVGRTRWESVESTGEGGEVTGREPLPFEARAEVGATPDAAALRVTAAECL
jgi:hypothetical protein